MPEGGSPGARVKTGIPGMDDVISGGLPAGTVTIICGPTGCGKTLFALQSVYKGAMEHGEPGLFVTVEESRPSIERAARQYGMDLPRAAQDGKMLVLDMAGVRKRAPEEVSVEELVAGFNALMRLIAGVVKERGIKRVALDSLTAISLYYAEDESFLRREMFRFIGGLRSMADVTSLLVSESQDRMGEHPRYLMEQYLADSHIAIGLERVQGEYRRSVTVPKMRYTPHDSIVHPLLITEEGLEVEPETRVK
jgi:KaiC/GvpD/RAD55 family RecA-like ATPase